jgi:hypothetical protein
MESTESLRLSTRADLFSVINNTIKMFVDADEFTSVCSDAISILNNQEALHVEAAALSRLLYRMKSKMRCDKGFKFMAKVGTVYDWVLSSQRHVLYARMMQITFIQINSNSLIYCDKFW